MTTGSYTGDAIVLLLHFLAFVLALAALDLLGAAWRWLRGES